MIKLEKIGSKYTVNYNSMTFTVTIKNDPSQYEYYKTLGLDVFEDDERTILENKLTELEIRFRKNSSLQTLRDKLPNEEE